MLLYQIKRYEAPKDVALQNYGYLLQNFSGAGLCISFLGLKHIRSAHAGPDVDGPFYGSFIDDAIAP